MNKTTLVDLLRLFVKPSLLCCLVIGTVGLAGTADASETNVLFTAAKKYEQAVANVDSVICRSRTIRSADRAMVDRLQRAAKRMVTAAKNPRHINRLRFERKKVIPLQLQVETILFDKYSPNIELATAWEYLLYSQAVFEDELAFLVENPRRGKSIQRRIESSQSGRYLKQPVLAPTSNGGVTFVRP